MRTSAPARSSRRSASAAASCVPSPRWTRACTSGIAVGGVPCSSAVATASAVAAGAGRPLSASTNAVARSRRAEPSRERRLRVERRRGLIEDRAEPLLLLRLRQHERALAHRTDVRDDRGRLLGPRPPRAQLRLAEERGRRGDERWTLVVVGRPDARRRELRRRERRQRRQPRPDPSIVEPRVGLGDSVLGLEDERVGASPVDRHERERRVLLKTTAHVAELLARHVERADVPEARRLVHVGGDEEEPAARLLAHDPHQAVAEAVDGRHPRLDGRAENRHRRRGRRGRRRRGDPGLLESIEQAADLLARRAVARPLRVRCERRGDDGGQGIGVDGGVERGEQRARRVDRVAHVAGFVVGGGVAAFSGAAGARGNSASRASTWSWIQWASHHSTGSTWMPWTMTLKWR